jgi:nucleotide-binding universal stress UspA family protein
MPLLESGLGRRADDILTAFKDQCERAGIHPEIKKAVGIIDETIIEEGRNCDWILLARRGDHMHIEAGGLIGTTAESVVRHAGKPVMVTPAAFREIESIGLAYDDSLPARNALRLAMDLSQEAGWPLSVVIIKDHHDTASALVGKVEDSIDAAGIDGTVIVLKGKEDVQILKFIQEGSVELMIMGAYGHNRLRELLLGSTTSFIINQSVIPILLTR